MEYYSKPKKVTAEQWTKGKKIKDVIDESYKETGHWSDRFTVRPDVCIVINGNPVAVNEGDWIVRDGDQVSVLTNREFRENFNIKADGITLTLNEIDHLHDVVYDTLELASSVNDLSHAELVKIFVGLPDHLKKDAQRWGLNDTVVRDSIYRHLEENPL